MWAVITCNCRSLDCDLQVTLLCINTNITSKIEFVFSVRFVLLKVVCFLLLQEGKREKSSVTLKWARMMIIRKSALFFGRKYHTSGVGIYIIYIWNYGLDWLRCSCSRDMICITLVKVDIVAPCKRIRNPANVCCWNPESTMVWNPESTALVWNPEGWNPESKGLESRI